MRTKSKVDIEKTIENRNLQDQILEVSVPMQEVVEVKNGAGDRLRQEDVPGLCTDPHGYER